MLNWMTSPRGAFAAFAVVAVSVGVGIVQAGQWKPICNCTHGNCPGGSVAAQSCSCCYNSTTATWSCKACTTSFDCLTPPAPYTSCQDGIY
jgi:hypothetical protein